MRLARLERLVERAERLAAVPTAEQMLEGAGHVEVGGMWFNPFHFVDRETFVQWTRAIRDAEKRGDEAALQRLDEEAIKLFEEGVAVATAQLDSLGR